jgi:hypothetical protein
MYEDTNTPSLEYYTINSGEAPQPFNFRGRGSTWRDKFESMKPGQWFIVCQKDAQKTQAAAADHLKGRYSFYKINDDRDFCLLKIR